MPSSSDFFDILLTGGNVLDGTGAEPFRADVGVQNGRIVFVGTSDALQKQTARRVWDVSGKFVAPGFIDIHTHSDLSVLFTPQMDSSLAQGVTTEVVGNCGFSVGLAQNTDEFTTERARLERSGVRVDWDDLGGFLRRVQSEGVAINIATLAGHGTLRKRTMGTAARTASPQEITAMQADLARAMEAGAIGLSSGLEYVPGMYGDVAELAALARVARENGGFYATHLRDEGDTLLESVEEAIAVAEAAQIALQLSHHKSEKPHNWGKVVESLALVDAAQARGVDILLDQYPYTAYQTGLGTIALPPWAIAGSSPEMAARLSDREMREKIKQSMNTVNWGAVEIASCANHREFQGQTVENLALQAGLDPRDWVLNLLGEADGWVSAAHFALSEKDVETVMQDKRVMIGSDAVAISPTGPMAGERPHPRSYGAFARVLGKYVREKQILTWAEAVRRMTSLPARRLGFADRGTIAPGFIADITVFDPLRINDTATFADPHRLAEGVDLVLVGGNLAWDNEGATNRRDGRVLRGGGQPL